MMEKTLVLIKPGALQRGLVGEITNRFEKKGLRLAGMKMMQLTDEFVCLHYEHLAQKPYFSRIKDAMKAAPIIACCYEGVDAVHTVRMMVGSTNGREAAPGTIRGDYSMSIQENVVHASDTLEKAAVELKRFFNEGEIFDYQLTTLPFMYASDEF